MKTIIGVFDTYAQAEEAFAALGRIGYSADEVSLMAQENVVPTTVRTVDTAEGTAEGVAGGAMLGGLAGLLVGIGAIAIPGIGPVLAAGPIAAALSTAAVGAGIGAATGGIVGALVDLGMSDTEAQTYAEAVERGGILLMVKANEKNLTEVSEILRAEGAADIQTRATVRHRVRT